MATETFHNAKKNKNDEFYTDYRDIENEIGNYVDYNSEVFRDKVVLLPCDDPETSNFTRFFVNNFKELGLKRIISTSVAESSVSSSDEQLDLFNLNASIHDKSTEQTRGKIFSMTSGDSGAEKSLDRRWQYLEGNGDFRSEEISKLALEADIIITNPPFSLFREFITWIYSMKKNFLVVSNMNALTYKEVYPKIQEDSMWLGVGFGRDFHGFVVPDDYPLVGSETKINSEGKKIVYTNNTLWLTNIDHGRRHHKLDLLPASETFKKTRHKKLLGKSGYDRYDNLDAIEVPYSDSIPADFNGVMGVPISFLHWYSPDQFLIVGFRKGSDGKDLKVDGKSKYFRVLIKHLGNNR